MEGKDSRRKWGSLLILTSVFIVGELSHFLLGIVTRPMAQEIHYGTQECLINSEFSGESNHTAHCLHANDSFRCELAGSVPGENGSLAACVWDFSGLGLEYQVLAGPSFIAVFTVCGIVLGFLADRFNRKVIVSACMCLLTAATTLMGFATQYWHLVLLRMAIGAGESVFSPACSSMISDMFSQERRGAALGIFNWGIYFGYGLSYAIGNFVTNANILEMGWRWSYFVSGFIGGGVIIFLIAFVSEPERKTGEAIALSTDSTSSEKEEKGAEVVEVSCTLFYRILHGRGGLLQISRAILNPAVLMLILTACVRHTAGFTWAYNTQLYFTTYYPRYNLGIWITAVSIIGGTLGVVLGGFVSDRFVNKIGLRARVYVLAASQFIATPFAVGVLYFEPPTAFYILLGTYLFAEMWFGVLFAVLLELIPTHIHSISIAVFLFVMNNVGGNAPMLVEPLRRALSYHSALLILYPGFFFASSVLFLITSRFIPLQKV